MNGVEEFARMLAQDPKLAERLQRRAEIDEFKMKYNVERATPFKCPACTQWGKSGGSLWIGKDDKSRFVCRGCKLEWKIICLTLPTEELIIQIKEASKK